MPGNIPAPDFAAAGIAVFAPDQRGFGATSVRGYWPGTQALVDDTRTMARLLHQRYPHAKLILMGESMGAAVLMCLATAPTRRRWTAMCWWRPRCGGGPR